MNVVKSEKDFQKESISYWNDKYHSDSRGKLINHPSSYVNSKRDSLMPLYEKILSYKPSSVLEIGCNVGGNLNQIQKLDESINISGIELNPNAITLAKDSFNAINWNLIEGNALNEKTWEQAESKYDVIFTCAFLIHISPGNDKKYIIEKIKSRANKAIIMLESHTFTDPVLDVRKDKTHSPYCIDNYSNYGDFKIEKIEAMKDYPGNIQALIYQEI